MKSKYSRYKKINGFALQVLGYKLELNLLEKNLVWVT